MAQVPLGAVVRAENNLVGRVSGIMSWRGQADQPLVALVSWIDGVSKPSSSWLTILFHDWDHLESVYGYRRASSTLDVAEGTKVSLFYVTDLTMLDCDLKQLAVSERKLHIASLVRGGAA